MLNLPQRHPIPFLTPSHGSSSTLDSTPYSFHPNKFWNKGLSALLHGYTSLCLCLHPDQNSQTGEDWDWAVGLSALQGILSIIICKEQKEWQMCHIYSTYFYTFLKKVLRPWCTASSCFWMSHKVKRPTEAVRPALVLLFSCVTKQTITINH